MTPKTRRTVRRALRKARWPILYVLFLVVSLGLFLGGMRSCSGSSDGVGEEPTRGVDILQER